MDETILKIKTCKTCGSTENKFQAHRYNCIKCLSKKYRNKEYFSNYYKENKEVIKKRQMTNYHKPKIVEEINI